MKITFFGTPYFVGPVRKVLSDSFELTEDFKKSDLIVVASYGKILSKEILDSPKYGAINVHPSDLPKYRGPSPLQTQILDKVKESAVTFIKMDEEVDHGPILGKIPFEILDGDTFQSLAEKVFKLASEKIIDVIERYINKQIDPSLQDHSLATFTKIIRKDNGYVDFTNPPEKEMLNRMIRAYFPWPGVWTKFKIQNGDLKIIKLLPNNIIQVEGKNPMSFKDFINGYPNGGELLSKLNLL